MFTHILITTFMSLVQCNEISFPHTATEMYFGIVPESNRHRLPKFCRIACQMISTCHAQHLGNFWMTQAERLTCCAQTALPFWKLLNLLSLWLAGWLNYPLVASVDEVQSMNLSVNLQQPVLNSNSVDPFYVGRSLFEYDTFKWKSRFSIDSSLMKIIFCDITLQTFTLPVNKVHSTKHKWGKTLKKLSWKYKPSKRYECVSGTYIDWHEY